MSVPKPVVIPVTYTERMFFDAPAPDFGAPDYSIPGKSFRPELQKKGIYGKPVSISYDTSVPPRLVTTHLPDPEIEPSY